MDNIIHKALKESIERLILNERLSSTLYHFTYIGGLYKILKSDSFKLRSAYGRLSDDMHKTKKFYLSCTRQKNGLMGYSRKMNVRITLDGDMLNANFEGGAVDYWGSSMGKQAYYNKKSYKEVPYLQSDTENEDRLFSDKPVIRNATKYMKRIDVVVNNLKNPTTLSFLFHILISGYRNMIYIYDNEKDFNYQTDNTINDKIQEMRHLYDSIPNTLERENSVIYGLSHILSFFIVVDNLTNKNYKEYTSKLLRKYNLEKYITYVFPKINLHMNAENIDSTTIDDIRTNTDSDTYEKIFLMLRDFLRERGFNNIQQAISYVRKRNKQSYWGDANYDTEKTINVFAFQPNGLTNRRGNTIILHPEKTLFWDIKEIQHNKSFFIQDLERKTLSHKSKNDESFYKFLQHLVKGKVTVSQMLNYLSKIHTDEENIIDYLFGGEFKYIPMKYYHIDGQKYVNDTDEEELKEMFKM